MTYTSSRPDHWTHPRAYTDESLRKRKHGPIQPLYRPTLIERMLGRG